MNFKELSERLDNLEESVALRQFDEDEAVSREVDEIVGDLEEEVRELNSRLTQQEERHNKEMDSMKEMINGLCARISFLENPLRQPTAVIREDTVSEQMTEGLSFDVLFPSGFRVPTPIVSEDLEQSVDDSYDFQTTDYNPWSLELDALMDIVQTNSA